MNAEKNSKNRLLCEDTLKDINNKRNHETVFVIGGGPSVKRLLKNKDILQGKDVICCNNGYRLFPDCIFTHFADKIWYGWHKNDYKIHENYKGILTSSTVQTKKDERLDDHLICYFTNSNFQGSFSENINEVQGNNTGHQILNIAYHVGWKNAILFGYDMNPLEKHSNYHEEHKRVTNRNVWNDTMKPGFHKLVGFLEKSKKDFNIYNANSKSTIKSFPFVDFRDYL